MGKSLWEKQKPKKRKKKKVVDPSSPVSDGEIERDPNACIFCHSVEDNENLYGRFLKKDGIITHYFCMLFASGLAQKGDDEQDGVFGFLPKDIYREINRGNRFKCIYCRNRGATIGCCMKSCRHVFHFKCGRENDTLNQFFGNFNSYCGLHRLKQSIPASDLLALPATNHAACAICMCPVDACVSPQTLRTPCCKNSWYHRECIQHQALSAGLHFFKCPLCNNKDKFQKEMLTFGIYIPDQDASWEREENAFQELLERHDRCDVRKCLCKKGRSHKSSGVYAIVLCDMCGSQGTHVACSNLVDADSDWLCHDCNVISKKVKSVKKDKVQKSSSAKAKAEKKKTKKFDMSLYLEEKGRSSYKSSTAFPNKGGMKRKCSAAAGGPSGKKPRLMEFSIKLTPIDKELKNWDTCTFSPGKTSVRFHSPKKVVISNTEEEYNRSQLDLSRFKMKLEALKQQRLQTETKTSPVSGFISSPLSGIQIETEKLRRKIASIRKARGEISSDLTSEPSKGVSYFCTSPFPKKGSILGDNSLTESSFFEGKSSENSPWGASTPSSSSDFTPSSSANYHKKNLQCKSESPVFMPSKKRSSSICTEKSVLSPSSPNLSAREFLHKLGGNLHLYSPDDTMPRSECRSPQLEVSSAGTHINHSECNSERMNQRNIVQNVGKTSWSASSFYSKQGLPNRMLAETKQPVKKLDFKEDIDNFDLPPTLVPVASEGSTSCDLNTRRLYPSQVPLSKPVFDKLWSSSSDSESDVSNPRRSSQSKKSKPWYYLPKSETKVAKYAFKESKSESRLRSDATINRLRRRSTTITRFRPGKAEASTGKKANADSDDDFFSPTSHHSSQCSPLQSRIREVLSRSSRVTPVASTSQDDIGMVSPDSPGSNSWHLKVDTSPSTALSENSLGSPAHDRAGPSQPAYISLDSLVENGSWDGLVAEQSWTDFMATNGLETIADNDPPSLSPVCARSPPSSATAIVLSDSDDTLATSRPITEHPGKKTADATNKFVSNCEESIAASPYNSSNEHSPKHISMTSEFLPLKGLPQLRAQTFSDIDSDTISAPSLSCQVSPRKNNLPVSTNNEKSVVVIDSDDEGAPNVRPSSQGSQGLVDLTNLDDDDSDDVVCVSTEKHKAVVNLQNYLQPGFPIFRGPGNKVLIPVSKNHIGITSTSDTPINIDDTDS